MTSVAASIIGACCCVLAVLFAWLTWVVVRDYPLYVHGPQKLAQALSLTPAGRTRNDAPFWYVGTLGDRPLAIAVAQNFRRNAWAPGVRSRRQSVLRMVVGCRAEGEVFVWTALPGNRVVKAGHFGVDRLIGIAQDNGFGLTAASGAPPEVSPKAPFAGDWPSLCWIDHPDIHLTDRREAVKLLDQLDRLVTELESR